jgi:hypothetical protein
MENKMIRVFLILLTIVGITFATCMFLQVYTLITQGTQWTSWLNFLWALPTPFVGYVMMLFGEYIDNKKYKKLQE